MNLIGYVRDRGDVATHAEKMDWGAGLLSVMWHLTCVLDYCFKNSRCIASQAYHITLSTCKLQILLRVGVQGARKA
jgi:hypothetical protein